MYARHTTQPLPLSASAQPSNLSRLSIGDQVFMCVAHKTQLMIVCVTDPTASPIIASPSVGGKPLPITQARWVPTLKRHLLVVTGRGGVVFYSWDAASLLKVVTLGEEGSSAGGEEGPAGGAGSTLLARGVASIDGQVAVGTSTGEVLVLRGGDGRILRPGDDDDEEDEELSHACDDDVGVESFRFRWRPYAVAALATCGDGRLAVGYVRGHVAVGRCRGNGIEKLWEVESYGSAVSCLASSDGLLLAGFLSGHLRVYQLQPKTFLAAEVCAHGRAVTGLDAVGTGDEGERLRGVSVGEDAFVRVWGITEDQETHLKVEQLHACHLQHQLLTGAAFTDHRANAFVTASYDLASLDLRLTT